jgi:hypothetical protein
MAEAGRYTQPGLPAQFDHDAIFNLMDANGERGLPARHGARPCCDLNGHVFGLSNHLRMHIATVEFRHQCVSNIIRFDVSVKDSSIHVFDYNPLYKRRRYVVAFYLYMTIYVVKRFWFKTLLGISMLISLGVGLFLTSEQTIVRAQEASTPTGIFVTVTYTDPINVRGGPSTIYYPIIGQLTPGEVVPALGVSPGREWIQISYAPTGGTGWVYSSFVSISGGELRIVEPPPTPTPPVTSTIDPTLAAAFNVQPTETRLPTFTPPPPLEVPEFNDASTPGSSSVVFGIFIVGLGLIGAIGLLVSYVLRR